MKTLIFIIFFTGIVLSNLNGQTPQKYFLGSDYHLYKGVVLEFDNHSTHLYTQFYSSYSIFNRTQFDRERRVLYRDHSKGTLAQYYTTPDSLFNRVFLVTDIIESDELKYSDDPLLVLEDTLTKQVIYFRYNKRVGHYWPFFSEEIEYDKELLCSYIVRRYDRFTNTTTINTPLLHAGKTYFTILMKHIEGNSTKYYLSLHLSTEINSGTGSSVILLFEDDIRINKQADVKFDGATRTGDSYWYEYKAMVPLNQNDLNTIVSKELIGFRLHVYDRFEPDNYKRKFFKTFSECVIQSE